jgi:uncharacterized repeat protein (TIGR03803 family)
MGTFARFALGICIVALINGCGASQSPIGTLGAIPQGQPLANPASSTNYRIVYSFGAPPDGRGPAAVLKYVDGTLFGTTISGGAYDCRYTTLTYGCGTVFGITPGGSEKMLHEFTEGDGEDPSSGFIDVKGTLYGTTSWGGRGGGVVYGITTTGSETVLHGFRSASLRPVDPDAGVVIVRGVFYGTTLRSGPPWSHESTFGTVFTVAPAGAFHILYRFKGGSDGSAPGSLINVNDTLYGITHEGGANGLGTMYTITTAGVERVLYSFKGGADGANPVNGLIDVNGTLYGATSYGGGGSCDSSSKKDGCGTIYSIATSGKEKVVYSFPEGADGAQPNGNLVDVDGVLYGTTNRGGTYDNGTVFSLTAAGVETVLHSFTGSPDGAGPGAGLIAVKKTLYGTTSGGGAVECGYSTSSSPLFDCGTVFALTLPRSLN